MILNFLQTRNPPILPSLHRKPHMRKSSFDAKATSFNDDLEQLRGHGQNNKESIGELLFNFFRRYAHDMDYEKHVVSVREGRLISKEAKKWHLMQNNRLCVEEPFNTERNLGNTADDISFRGIHLELRRAFDLISQSKLEECLEQYEFPNSEEKVFEKPSAKPAPVLRSRSQSQSSRPSRGGYGNRGARQNQYRSNNRRASSAAATNKYPLPVSEAHGFRGRDFLTREQQAQQAQEQAMALHQHFMLEMQHLHEQEQRLRLLQAQNQQAQLREASERSLSHQYMSREPSHRTAVANQVPLSVPLRPGPFYSPYAHPQVPGTPVPSAHTQPSSPSLKTAQPDLRRAFQRSSAAEAGSSNARSHSQPARPLPFNTTMQGAPPLPLNSQTFLQYQQQLRQQQQQSYGVFDPIQGRWTRPDGSLYPDIGRLPLEVGSEENIPKEYVGYWMNNESPPSYPYRDDHMMPLPPAYHEMHRKMRGVTPNIDRLRRTSRSPSPSTSLPFRDRSYSVRSASSAPIAPPRLEPSQYPPAGMRTGPTIVNGSDGWTISEDPRNDFLPAVDSSSHTTISETTSGSEDQQYETPITGEMDSSFYNHQPENGVYVTYQDQRSAESSRGTLLNGKAPEDVIGSSIISSDHDVTPTGTLKRSETTKKASGGLGIQFGEVEATHGSSKPEIPALHEHVQESSSKGIKGSDPITPTGGKFEKAPSALPLLSPVREVRTPSPLGKRVEEARSNALNNHDRLKMNLHIPSFAELIQAKQQREQQKQHQNGAPSLRPNGTKTSSKLADSTKVSPPSSLSPVKKNVSPILRNSHPAFAPPSSSQNKGQPPQINGWQQQSSKKNRKTRSRPGSEQFATGEPLPVNEADRKGG